MPIPDIIDQCQYLILIILLLLIEVEKLFEVEKMLAANMLAANANT